MKYRAVAAMPLSEPFHCGNLVGQVKLPIMVLFSHACKYCKILYTVHNVRKIQGWTGLESNKELFGDFQDFQEPSMPASISTDLSLLGNRVLDELHQKGSE